MSDSANIKFCEDEYTRVASALKSAASALESCAFSVPGAPSGPAGIGSRLASCRSQLRETADRASWMARNTLKAACILSESESHLTKENDNADGSASEVSSISQGTGTQTVGNTKYSDIKILTSTGLIADTFGGVAAKYTAKNMILVSGTNKLDYSTGEQCSAFVNRFYNSSTGVLRVAEGIVITGVSNLYPNGYVSNGVTYNGIPKLSYTVNGASASANMERVDTSVSTPQEGDILSQIKNGVDGEHWAIVKAVEGDNVIVIEENAMWYNQGTSEVDVPVEQRYSIKDNYFYRIPSSLLAGS